MNLLVMIGMVIVIDCGATFEFSVTESVNNKKSYAYNEHDYDNLELIADIIAMMLFNVRSVVGGH